MNSSANDAWDLLVPALIDNFEEVRGCTRYLPTTLQMPLVPGIIAARGIRWCTCYLRILLAHLWGWGGPG